MQDLPFFTWRKLKSHPQSRQSTLADFLLHHYSLSCCIAAIISSRDGFRGGRSTI
jgi:hypothetical protein